MKNFDFFLVVFVLGGCKAPEEDWGGKPFRRAEEAPPYDFHFDGGADDPWPDAVVPDAAPRRRKEPIRTPDPDAAPVAVPDAAPVDGAPADASVPDARTPDGTADAAAVAPDADTPADAAPPPPDVAPPPPPTPEVCDGVDNDGDGEVDEEMAGVIFISAGEYISPIIQGSWQVDAYCISLTETTVAQYRACVTAGACPVPAAIAEPAPQDCNWTAEPGDREAWPMNCLDFEAVQAYLAWRSVRLPTFDELAKAGRGGCELRGEPRCEREVDDARFPWGDNRQPTCGLAVIVECVEDEAGHSLTGPTCSLAAGNSPYGLCDVVGSVLEPTDACSDETCTFLGGSFMNRRNEIGAGYWMVNSAYVAVPTHGFRVAADVGWRPPE